MRTNRYFAVVVVALVSVVGCKPGGGGSEDSASEPSRELVIFAAASLTEAFGALDAEFEREHPQVAVTINFAGSQSLRTQIENGAMPDVFASANASHAQALRDKELVGDLVTFAHNELVIVVPPGNPAGIHELSDLPNASRLVLAGDAVPAGAYANQVLDKACSALGDDFAERVNAKVVSRETHVRQTLQKVVLGEADAAMVYATDAASVAGKVEVIRIPPELNVIASYPLVTVNGSPRAGLGRRFVEFVLSQGGQDKLQEFGFRPAEAKAK